MRGSATLWATLCFAYWSSLLAVWYFRISIVSEGRTSYSIVCSKQLLDYSGPTRMCDQVSAPVADHFCSVTICVRCFTGSVTVPKHLNFWSGLFHHGPMPLSNRLIRNVLL